MVGLICDQLYLLVQARLFEKTNKTAVASDFSIVAWVFSVQMVAVNLINVNRDNYLCSLYCHYIIRTFLKDSSLDKTW